MKTFFIIPTLKCGGAEHVSITFAKQLKDQEVKFINLGVDEGELKESIERNFPLISLNSKRSISACLGLRKIIKKEKPDYIFATHIHVAVILLMILPGKSSKVIVRIPTMPSNELYKGFKIKVLEFLERKLFKKAYAIIAQTDEMKQEINRILKIELSKIVTITNPVDIDQIDEQTRNSTSPYDSTKDNYLAVGNISPAKAYDVLIKSFETVVQHNPNAHLHILGRYDSEYAAGILEIAKGCPNIHFHGFCQTPYIYMKHCSTFVLSSRMEGLPNVVLEAMYLNKPVVATTCVPIIDKLITSGINGFKAEPENAISLADAMIKALEIKDIHNKYCENSNEFLKLFKK